MNEIIETQEFQPLGKATEGLQQHPSVYRRKIIKSQRIALGNPVKIESQINGNNHNAGKIEPILLDGSIVGVRYRCQCGAVAEIMFEYDGFDL